jgi:hypothetical protein
MEKIEMAQADPVSKQATDSDEQYPTEQPFKENEPLLDLESQQEQKQELSHRPTEPVASRTKTLIYLATYFVMNLSLTFYNKAVMGSVCIRNLSNGSMELRRHVVPIPVDSDSSTYWECCSGEFNLPDIRAFPADETDAARASGPSHVLTLIHVEHRNVKPVVASTHHFLHVYNRALTSNLRAMVSVPFHQIMRATCPLFTILIYRIVFSRRYALITYLSIVPVMLGVGLATFGDYHFTAIGFTLTLIGVVLAAIKVSRPRRITYALCGIG